MFKKTLLLPEIDDSKILKIKLIGNNIIAFAQDYDDYVILWNYIDKQVADIISIPGKYVYDIIKFSN